MDAVDILTVSVRAAQEIRSASDPEAVLSGAYAVLDRDPPRDQDEAIAIRIVRLIVLAGDRRPDVLAHLRTRLGPLPWNRPDRVWVGEPSEDGGSIDPDPEAQSLLEFVESGRGDAVDMFERDFGPFEIATRSIVKHFEIEDAAGRLEPIDRGAPPKTVRGLIDYPMDSPVLSEIEVGMEPWSVWDICCAFADQYEKIYENPTRFGVWGHDLTDLWIEHLVYYPKERLIYPGIGS